MANKTVKPSDPITRGEIAMQDQMRIFSNIHT
jgi:hypothetical protein